MQSYLMSALAGLCSRIDYTTFSKTYPCCWLVLERGTWKTAAGAVTLAPSASSGTTTDPMAVPLVSAKRPGQLTLGRGTTCDITLSEATVSALHLLFMEAGQRQWTVRDAASRNGTWIGEQRLEPGMPCLLRDSEVIRVGHVGLTFHTPDGFFARLRMLAHHLSPSATRPQPRLG